MKYSAIGSGAGGSNRADFKRTDADYTTTESAGSHTHEITIQNTGASQAHNNLQPYIVVNYWVRTA